MFKPINILIVDDDPAMAKVFEKIAREEGWSYVTAHNGNDAIEHLNKESVEVAMVDIALPGYNGMQILEYITQNKIQTEVLIMTGVGSVEMAVQAIKMGAFDYFTKPFSDINKITHAIKMAMEHRRLLQKLHHMERSSSEGEPFEGMIGKSRKMIEVFDLIDNVATTNSTVLILGESGTGKELVAQALHNRSRRSDRPFVVINCSAVPEGLLESELFGHRKGSFTGAIADKKGLFEEADGGTIFLDEVGDIPPAIQVKLLRVLQEGEIRSVGENESRRVDVRIVAATNRNLSEMVAEGKFREDLFYRLNVITIDLPPLRERMEDVPPLAYHFLQKYSKKAGKELTGFSVDAMTAMQRYKWVGNVRELENIVERASVLTSTGVINARDLPPRVLGDSFYLTQEDIPADLWQFSYQDAKERAFMAFNKAYLTGLLRQSKGNVSYAAAKAGMDRSNFKKILKKTNINLEEFKKNR